MGNKPPANIASAIKDVVYQKADEFCYLARDRVMNGQFLDRLVEDARVGKVLEEHIPRAEVRTYIKDAILNRYSKDKTAEAFPANPEEIVSQLLGADFHFVETHATTGVSLFRNACGERYAVTASGTYLKWETALRKALLYPAGRPFMNNTNSIEFVLFLFAQSRKISDSEKKHLGIALSQCKAKAHLF
ncbi:hypothetical protein ACQZ4R_13110 [Agrobacterium vitis]